MYNHFRGARNGTKRKRDCVLLELHPGLEKNVGPGTRLGVWGVKSEPELGTRVTIRILLRFWCQSGER